MLDWVKRSFQLYAVRHAKVDMRRQIDVYAGMDDSEVAFLLVGATYCRLELERRGVLPRQCLDVSLPRGPEVHLAQGGLPKTVIGRALPDGSLSNRIPFPTDPSPST